MTLYDNSMYLDDVNMVAMLDLPWDKLQGKSVLISGATGLVGSFLVDVMMKKNEEGLGCTVYALSRNAERAAKRFVRWQGNPYLQFIAYDINLPFVRDDLG